MAEAKISKKKDAKSKKAATAKRVSTPAEKAVAKPKADKKPVNATLKMAEKKAASETTEIIDKLVEAEAVAEEIQEIKDEVKPIAKAGKRSAKALKETEEKQAKEERKAAAKKEALDETKPKIQHKPARSRLERRGKKYRKISEQIDKSKQYSLKEALDLAVKTNPAKFDASVELHIRLGVDPRQADQNIRATVSLPSGSGKTVRVAVFAEDEDVNKAKKAGADVAGSDEFLQQLEKEQINFDTLIATPAVMSKLSKYARVLGPKGLMPNPKSGTVTANVKKAVQEAKSGRLEYRVDSTGIVHVAIGKVSFGTDKLVPNAEAVIESIKSNKPASLKGNYVLSQYVTTSMGPSIAFTS